MLSESRSISAAINPQTTVGSPLLAGESEGVETRDLSVQPSITIENILDNVGVETGDLIVQLPKSYLSSKDDARNKHPAVSGLGKECK